MDFSLNSGLIGTELGGSSGFQSEFKLISFYLSGWTAPQKIRHMVML